MLKRFLLVISLLVTLFSVSAFAQTKMALVDLEGAMNRSEAGLEANNVLKAELEKAQNKAQKLKSEKDAITKDLETQRSVLSQDAIQKKLGDIQKKNVEMERLEKDTSDELQAKQVQLANAIIVEMRQIIIDYAKEKKIELILEAKEAGTVYADPKLDITEDIIKRYNTQWKNKKK